MRGAYIAVLTGMVPGIGRAAFLPRGRLKMGGGLKQATLSDRATDSSICHARTCTHTCTCVEGSTQAGRRLERK